jgi:hypothetical protein
MIIVSPDQLAAAALLIFLVGNVCGALLVWSRG